MLKLLADKLSALYLSDLKNAITPTTAKPKTNGAENIAIKYIPTSVQPPVAEISVKPFIITASKTANIQKFIVGIIIYLSFVFI